MKDLLQMNPQVIIENFEAIKLTGKYRILRFEENCCSFRLNGFHIEIEAKSLRIEVLQEHLTYLIIESLKSISITEGGER